MEKKRFTPPGPGTTWWRAGHGPGTRESPWISNVYSDAEEVELFINDKSLGRRKVGMESRYTARFSTVYEPGTVTAVAYAGGNEISWSALATSGPAVRLSLTSRQE